MKTLLLCACAWLALPPGGDREKGLEHYRAGRFAEAAASFRAAIQSEGDSPELQFNLALASWRAGELPAAETAAEKYAALASPARADLHAGLLGAVRFDEAKALEAKADALHAAAGQGASSAKDQPPAEDPLAVLEQALQKAGQARDHFVRGATQAASPELLRNTERALRYLDDLQKKADEWKKQREQQPKDQEQKDSDKKDEKPADDTQDKPQDQKQEQKQDQKDPQQKDEPKGKPEQKPGEQPAPEKPQGEGEQGEPKPEPKPGEAQEKPAEPEPSKDPQAEPKPEPEPAQDKPRSDAPGEAVEGRELTPEQTQRLLESLQNLDQKLKDFRARAKSGRRPVERDW